MSSAAYEAKLVPRRLLRLAVLSLASGATLAGAALILSLPVVHPLKASFCLLWLLAGALELQRFRRGMARIYRISIQSDGSVEAVDGSEAKHRLQLLPGTVVLERVAWLRLRFEDGLRYGELMAGNAAENQHWRRLLVIWRHRGHFGRPRRS